METVVSTDDNSRFLYFAYGSNLNVDRLRIHSKSAELLERGVLANYRLTFDKFAPRWGGAVADIVPDDDDEVHGGIWSIAMTDLKNLDAQEGVHLQYYRRIEVSVTSASGKQLQCFTYRMLNSDDPQPPSALYMSVIMEGATSLDLPQSYLKRLSAIATNDYADDVEYRKAVEKQESDIF